MIQSNGGNAMTEVALALAMAFFAIMVLTLISFGASKSNQKNKDIVGLDISMGTVRKGDSVVSTQTQVIEVNKDRLIVLHEGALMDSELQSIDIATYRKKTGVILAVSPSTSVKEIIMAKESLVIPDLKLSVLDQRWIEVLKERDK